MIFAWTTLLCIAYLVDSSSTQLPEACETEKQCLQWIYFYSRQLSEAKGGGDSSVHSYLIVIIVLISLSLSTYYAWLVVRLYRVVALGRNGNVQYERRELQEETL